MLAFNLKLSKPQYKELEDQLKIAETRRDLSEVKRILALLSLAAGQLVEDISDILKLSIETVRLAVHKFLLGAQRWFKNSTTQKRHRFFFPLLLG